MGIKRRMERIMSQVKLSMLIDYYIGDMQRRNLTPDSVNTNHKALGRFTRFLSKDVDDIFLSDVREKVIEAYVTDLQTRKVKWRDHPNREPEAGMLSPFTIRKEVKILRGFGTWLQREGFDNPFTNIPIPKEPKRLVKVLTDEEIEKILRSINPKTPTGSRLYAIVLFMLDSGPRVSEVVNVRLPNVEMNHRQIRLIGKGDKERIVPFGSRCAKAFLNYLHLYRPQPMLPEYDHLFLSMDGMPMTRNSLGSVMQRLKKSSGVARLHGHLFRHTFAVKYLLNGGDLITLQRILGHESLEVTKRYLQLTSAQVQIRYESFSPVDRLPLDDLRRFGNKKQKENT